MSSYIGMVESFSSYQALLQKDPEEARRLSTHITHRSESLVAHKLAMYNISLSLTPLSLSITFPRLLAVMGVTSSETEVIVGVRYFYLLACKPGNE